MENPHMDGGDSELYCMSMDSTCESLSDNLHTHTHRGNTVKAPLAHLKLSVLCSFCRVHNDIRARLLSHTEREPSSEKLPCFALSETLTMSLTNGCMCKRGWGLPLCTTLLHDSHLLWSGPNHSDTAEKSPL